MSCLQTLVHAPVLVGNETSKSVCFLFQRLSNQQQHSHLVPTVTESNRCAPLKLTAMWWETQRYRDSSVAAQHHYAQVYCALKHWSHTVCSPMLLIVQQIWRFHWHDDWTYWGWISEAFDCLKYSSSNSSHGEGSPTVVHNPPGAARIKPPLTMFHYHKVVLQILFLHICCQSQIDIVIYAFNI